MNAQYENCQQCGGRFLKGGHICKGVPRDYVTPEERMSQALRSGPLPRAERRHRDLDTGVLVCILGAMVWGAACGALFSYIVFRLILL